MPSSLPTMVLSGLTCSRTVETHVMPMPCALLQTRRLKKGMVCLFSATSVTESRAFKLNKQDPRENSRTSLRRWWQFLWGDSSQPKWVTSYQKKTAGSVWDDDGGFCEVIQASQSGRHLTTINQHSSLLEPRILLGSSLSWNHCYLLFLKLSWSSTYFAQPMFF